MKASFKSNILMTKRDKCKFSLHGLYSSINYVFLMTILLQIIFILLIHQGQMRAGAKPADFI